MDENDAVNMLINPYYVINIQPSLAEDHEPVVSQEKWVQANLKLIDEIGAHEWLQHLLAVLQGDSPPSPV
jgi:hypothetical protein